MDWKIILAVVVLVGLFLIFAKRSGCCGMKGKQSSDDKKESPK